MIALFNRALMLDNTGDYQGAIRDINAVIKEFPNFWTGYQFRAEVRRKLGDTKGAEQDEFKVLKAQMEMRYGNKKNVVAKSTRKVSDRTMEDYDKLVEADTESDDAPSYESEYRGKIQNRKTELRPEPYLVLSYYSKLNGFQRRIYNKELEQLNAKRVLPEALLMTNEEIPLDEEQVQKHFLSIRTLSDKIALQPSNAMWYFTRAIDEYLVQDFEKAMSDVNRVVELDSTFVLGYFLRAQIRMKNQEVRNAEQGQGEKGGTELWNFDASRPVYQAALADCDRVLAADPNFAGCYYNKGNIYLKMNLWAEAIASYTRALECNSGYADAYYNRGVAYILSGDTAKGVADLSHAGEMGLYKAYNLIKRYGNKVLAEKK